MKIFPLALTSLTVLVSPVLAFQPFGTNIARTGSLFYTSSSWQVPLRRNNHFSSIIPLQSSATGESTEATVAHKAQSRPVLSPEYTKAKEYVMSTIRSSTPPDFPMSKWEGFLDHFVTEYGTAIQASGKFTPDFFASNILSVIQFGMKFGLPSSPDHYTFDSTHTAIREPFDYYEWGCNFFRPVMDLDHSAVLGTEHLQTAFEQIKAGDNVVFLANHQSEADPQVFSCLLETAGFGKEAAEITYVAGHKVRTDVLAVPFSMGRCLLCIHSKKHIDADPDSRAEKMTQNLRTMSAMQRMMKKGGLSLWVAPSGGRDRRNVSTGEVPIAPFDQKTVDMFRLMANKSKTPTHFYPLSMVSYDLCPPPDAVEATTGEERNVRFESVGIACGKAMENVGGLESRHLFTEHAQRVVEENFQLLLKAIDDKKKGK